MKKKNKNSQTSAGTWIALLYIFITVIATFHNWRAGLILLGIGIVILMILNRANILTIIGISQYGKKNYAKALRYLKAGHNSGAAKMGNSYNYAYILLREGRLDDARIAINYALKNPKIKDNETYQGKEILSMICYKQGDYAQATKIMQTVFDHYKNSNVYGALGYYKILSGAPDAEAFALEAYEYNKNDKVILDNLVQLYYEKGDYATAKKYADEATGAQATGIETYYHAALVEKALGNADAAKENFKKALSFTPSFLTTVTTEEIERQISTLE